MRTKEEVEATIAECEAQNKRMSDEATAQYKLPYHKRDPEFNGERSADRSRFNNVTMSTLRWVLGSDVDPTWAPTP